jgi:hypothetical protein
MKSLKISKEIGKIYLFKEQIIKTLILIILRSKKKRRKRKR